SWSWGARRRGIRWSSRWASGRGPRASRPMRLAAAVTLLVCLAGVGVARAQTDKAPLPDAAGATAAPSVTVTPDGGAPAPAPDQPPLEAAPAESGPGLFEQSTAAAASAPAGGVAAEPAAPPVGPFTLSGYVRGDMFAG